MSKSVTKTQVLEDIDNLRTTVQTLRLQMGPANADYSLERLARVEAYVRAGSSTRRTYKLP